MKRLRIRAVTTALNSSQSTFRIAIPYCQRCDRIRQYSAATESPLSSLPPNAFPVSTMYTSPIPKPKLRQTLAEQIPSPPPELAPQSAKLAALHARLALSRDFPVQTLARTLIDKTADPDRRFNNSALASLGSDLLGLYCSEHLICQYPRLPIEVLWAAQRAYVGAEALATITREWGVDAVVAPGGEVDPGLLQYQPKTKDQLHYEEGYHAQKRAAEREALLPESLRANKEPDNAPANWTPQAGRHRISDTYRVMHGDQFGLQPPSFSKIPEHTTLEDASSNFVRALIAGIHLHNGQAAAKAFFDEHFMSRALDLTKMFMFERPNRDLLLLCLREGFERPVARLISETGRKSAHPVFVVGVFSGLDKLGEGVGGSIAEAKTRAAVAALKGWYLYSPLDVTLPSDTVLGLGAKKWKPNMVDCGEVVVY